jgi:hypothetical protein
LRIQIQNKDTTVTIEFEFSGSSKDTIVTTLNDEIPLTVGEKISKSLKGIKKKRDKKCKYCGKMFSGVGIKTHEKKCEKDKQEKLKKMQTNVTIPMKKEQPLVTVFEGKVIKETKVNDNFTIHG